jgi:heme/copper-type cytochrome/quinol oxidase subunit 4
MTQSRKHSAIEAITGVAIGFVVSVIITALVMPAYGHQVTLADNIQITLIFTVASIVRGYAVRRLFVRWGRG